MKLWKTIIQSTYQRINRVERFVVLKKIQIIFRYNIGENPSCDEQSEVNPN